MNVLGKRLLMASACVALMSSGQAVAQTAGDGEVGEVIVTGSRIKRADIEGVGPATVIGAPEIAKSGAVNVEALLQRLPWAVTRAARATPTGRRGVGVRRPSTCAASASTGRSS